MSTVTVEFTDGSHAFDATLPITDTTTIGALITAANQASGISLPSAGVYLARTGTFFAATETAVQAGVRNGDSLQCVAIAPPHRSTTASLVVEIISPDSPPHAVPLAHGEYTIGRDTSSAIAIPHASVSRQHANLRVQHEAAVTDLGSANGTAHNGQRCVPHSATAIFPGSVVQVGDVFLAFHSPASLPSHLGASDAELLCNRPPRVAVTEPTTAFSYQRPPAAAGRRSIPVLGLLIPIGIGVVMAIVISPLYLLLGLAAPLMAIGSVLEDRRSGRKRSLAEQVKWRAISDVTTASIRTSHESVQLLRRRMHPSALANVAQNVSLAPTLWEVRPSNADFLETRAGAADLASVIRVNVPDQGDEKLLAELQQVASDTSIDSDAPVVLDLRTLGAIGLVGNDSDRKDMARAQIMQLVSRHSPNDLQLIVLAPSTVAEWDWAKWLPHARSDGALTIAADEGEADALFSSVFEIAESRAEAKSESLNAAASLPHLIVVIEPPIPVSPREASQLCTLARTAGITVLWLTAEAEQLPGACRAVLQKRGSGPNGSALGTVTFTDVGTRIEAVRLDRLSEQLARRGARALAAIRDNTSSGGGDGIPTSVNLVELLTPEPTSAANVVTRWARPPGGITAQLGRGIRGTVNVDLRGDGPHALVAGTTGAGKSELLQTWVAAMAANYPPNRVTFVLIDYKGGAAFKDCVDLPHTVGFVTDLDPHTAQRAMVSLEGELVRREHILADHGAKDLIDLEQRNLAAAPPALVIIIDEFAALKSEIPDFVNGLVDIAQRGRSLGVHLVLATQKPGGVIDGKIQANTNLRIALRMANSGESSDVLGRPLAASISRRTPGRAYVRIGETQMFEVQTGYVGGIRSTGVVVTKHVQPTLYGLGLGGSGRAATNEGPREELPTDLQTIVASCAAASAQLRIPAPFRPWLDPLPTAVSIATIESTPGKASSSGLGVVVGLSDEPEHQRQVPFELDLEKEGNVAIFGGPGVGKTTFLRTLAIQLARRFSPDQLNLYALDYASRGLLPLERLPHCGGVVTGDQLDRVRRLIEMLATAVTDRQERMASVGASTIRELERATGEVTPAIVVLIDGFAALWQAVEPLDRSEHIQRLLRVAGDGRGVGVHLVYTADRRASVVPALASVTGLRLVMNMPSPEEYSSLGFPVMARNNIVLPAGRVAVREGLDMQVGVVTNSTPDGVAQVEALTQLASSLTAQHPGSSVVPIEDLPQEIAVSSIRTLTSTPTDPLSALFGLDDHRRAPVTVSLASNPLFLVVGHDQSGKTTALITLTQELKRSTPDLYACFVSSRRSTANALWDEHTTGPTAVEALADLRARIETRVREPETATSPMLIVLDDAEDLGEAGAPASIEALVKQVRDANAALLVAMSTFRSTRSFNVWTQQMRANRHGLILRPEEEDGEVFNSRLPKRTGLRLPPGRGYLVARGTLSLIQVAKPD